MFMWCLYTSFNSTLNYSIESIQILQKQLKAWAVNENESYSHATPLLTASVPRPIKHVGRVDLELKNTSYFFEKDQEMCSLYSQDFSYFSHCGNDCV